MLSITAITAIAILLLYLIDLRKQKFAIKTVVTIAMFSAISLILGMIQIVKYPQGGGISLFSMLPTMMLSILYGRRVGVTGGVIFGLLKMLYDPFVVHPIQFILDYLLSNMALGLAGVFGKEKKGNIILGALLATALSVFASVISGVVFFGAYAPEGMNLWLYSFIYNFTSGGVEGILTTVLIGFLPMKRLCKFAYSYEEVSEYDR